MCYCVSRVTNLFAGNLVHLYGIFFRVMSDIELQKNHLRMVFQLLLVLDLEK